VVVRHGRLAWRPACRPPVRTRAAPSHRYIAAVPADAEVEPAGRVESGPDVVLTDHGLGADEVVRVARGGAHATLGPSAHAAMTASAALVEGFLAADEPVYGVTTGFGSLATTSIPVERTAELQLALIRSHAAGMGAEVEREVVRAMVLLRARSLAMGWSGARPEVAEGLLALLNAGLTPVVHEHGSLGASGDLAPLAEAALVLIGEGEVRGAEGEHRSAADALAAAGLAPVVLRAKEGLALINGTDGILGMLVLALADLRRLLKVADLTGAMSVEALLGTDRAFAADLQALRPQPGQAISAANLRRLLAGSAIVASHREGDPRVQDAYSLRCTPQVHGAARDTVAHAEAVAGHELVAAIDNPMILPDGRVESCGNFHGAPLAYVCDFLAIAIADVGALVERRTDRLLDRTRSHGLPPFLAPDAGVDSGMMIAHYAQAAMVAENRRLAVPASVDTIPTSAMQEDHVSMGWGAARKLRRSVANLERILAVELVCAARGLDLRAPLTPAAGTGAALAATRAVVGGPGPDRWLAPELAAAEALVRSGAVLAAAESAIGALE
jgi:histidine ammonia-lyase